MKKVEICEHCKKPITGEVFTLASETKILSYHQKCFIKIKLERNIKDFSRWGS